MPFVRSTKLSSDRVQNAGPGEPVELWIYSAFPKDNWVAHKASDLTHAEHPGTAIQVEDQLFEVTQAEETAEAGYTVRYGLKRWDPKHAVRQVVPYTPHAQAQSAADYLEETHKQVLRSWIVWLFPLAGLAPDPVQREWGKKTALNMAWVSAGSAAMLLALAFALRKIPGRYPDQLALTILVYYLAFESFFRLLRVAVSGKPHGTLVLVLPYLLWEAVARPEKRAKKTTARLKLSFERDEVIRRPGSGHLVIRSMLFDDILARPNPVRFEGVVYRPQRWSQQGKGLVRRWVYELERIEADAAGKYKEYTHPRTPERQKIVEAFTHRLDLTQSFSLLWGTYPRRVQLRLELQYQFGAAKFTALTAGVFLVGALLQIGASILWHTTVYAIAAPVYLIFESLYRLYQSRIRGQPAGSLVGYLLRLLIRPPR